MSVFRLATYNVHKCKGIDFRVSVPRIAQVMARLKADIIATQEILHSQAQAISHQINQPFVFGAVRQHAGENYGNAVFTRLPIVSTRQHVLTVRQREPRECLRVSIELPAGGVLHLFAIHLGTSFFERREQARQLASPDLLEHPDVKGSRIVAGDFNEWTRGLATNTMRRQFEGASPRSYPGVLPLLRLDHIYYDPLFVLERLWLERSRLALRASDHLPLVADFSVAETTP